MRYAPLGNTEIKVSKICLGTMTFGEQNTEEEAHQQLDYAIDQGINFIDTAEMYAVPGRKETQGLTEKYIGAWLKSRHDREKLIIATKITGPSKGLEYIRKPLKINPEQIKQAIEGSLSRLQTDYVDLYQLHWPERKTNYFGKLGYEHNAEDPWEDNFYEVLECLTTLIDQGKIRYIGLSNETPWGVHRMLQLAEKHDFGRVVSIQNPYSLLNRTFEVGLAEMSIREKVGLLAYSPMAFGLLSGKYHKSKDAPGRINLYPKLARYNRNESWEATQAYLEIANRAGVSPATLSLAFVNTRPFVTSNIIGATTIDQLKENIASIDYQPTDDIIESINEIHAKIPNPAP